MISMSMLLKNLTGIRADWNVFGTTSLDTDNRRLGPRADGEHQVNFMHAC